MADHLTHKYRRTDIGSAKPYIVYRCVVPGCSHYISEKLVTGRPAICWQCEGKFIMDLKALRLKPRCPECRGDAKKRKIDPNLNVDELLAELSMTHDDEE